MPKPIRISLDAMGGDHGAATVVPGAELALERHPGLRFVMFGDESVVQPLLDARPKLREATDFHHTTVAVAMDEKPSQAIRSGRGNPPCGGPSKPCGTRRRTQPSPPAIRRAHGHVQGLPQDDGSHRAPGHCGDVADAPRREHRLDVGATIGADAGHLVDMAIMWGCHGPDRL
jgi:glycerol-3-phosphate acyltransferase PlsX